MNSVKNQFIKQYLFNLVPDAVHPGNPPQLIRSFQLFIDVNVKQLFTSFGKQNFTSWQNHLTAHTLMPSASAIWAIIRFMRSRQT